MNNKQKIEEALEALNGDLSDWERYRGKWGVTPQSVRSEAAKRYALMLPLIEKTHVLVDKVLIEEMVEARAKATQGEWRRFHRGDTTDVHVKNNPKHAVVHWGGFDDSPHSRGQHGKNAYFITTAANNIAKIAAQENEDE